MLFGTGEGRLRFHYSRFYVFWTVYNVHILPIL